MKVGYRRGDVTLMQIEKSCGREKERAGSHWYQVCQIPINRVVVIRLKTDSWERRGSMKQTDSGRRQLQFLSEIGPAIRDPRSEAQRSKAKSKLRHPIIALPGDTILIASGGLVRLGLRDEWNTSGTFKQSDACSVSFAPFFSGGVGARSNSAMVNLSPAVRSWAL